MDDKLSCSVDCTHINAINRSKQSMPKYAEINNLAEVFKVFSDNTRLRIIYALSKNELCVCDICELLSLNQSAVSHQLRVLRNTKLVKYRKDGKQVFYSLDDHHVDQILSAALEHIREDRRD